MRMLYAERQAALVEAARRELGGLIEVRPAEAGMHVVGWLRAGLNGRAASRGLPRGGSGSGPVFLRP